MAGSTQSYVSSKRHEKWRQRKSFGDKESHLPTGDKPLLVTQFYCCISGLVCIWFLPLFQVTPFYIATHLSRRGFQSFTRALSLIFFIFWRALHYVTLVPSFPGVKKLHLSRYSKLPLSSLTWNKNPF